MSESPSQTAASPQISPPKSSRMSALLEVLQLIISLALVCCFLAWLLWSPDASSKTNSQANSSPPIRSSAEVDGSEHLSVELDSPLGHRLSLRTVSNTLVTEPLMHVTGRVVASRRPGPDSGKDFWQFNSVELLSMYSSWEKAIVDIQFTESQLQQIQALATAKETALLKAIERLEKLIRGGSETLKELATQQADLLQTQIQNRKDVYQAELAVKTSKREATTLSLQLFQSGFDPEKLQKATSDTDIVTAEVPEAMLDRVVIGQSCIASFYGIPDETFIGNVTTLSPVLSTDQRTLRVMFTVHDPLDRLRPGMFASIGLGTDPRNVLRIPAESVIHVGRTDYALVVDQPTAIPEKSATAATNTPPHEPTPKLESKVGDVTQTRVRLRVTPVVVAELIEGQVEVKSGISIGDQIVGDHGILLKPLVVTSLRNLGKPRETPKKLTVSRQAIQPEIR